MVYAFLFKEILKISKHFKNHYFKKKKIIFAATELM